MIMPLLNRFGESVDILHPLDQPFMASSGVSILQNLSFSQTKTNFVKVNIQTSYTSRGGKTLYYASLPEQT